MGFDQLTGMLPAELSPSVAAALVVLSFFTSGLTAISGLGGGVVMVTVMASLLPIVTVLPVHGLVQLGSNGGRMALMRRTVPWQILGLFTLGTLVGAVLAARVVVALPGPALQLALALFVLYAAWTRRLRPPEIPLPGFALVGAVTAFGSLFVGATGPFVAAFLSPQRMHRETIVACIAACMTVQHLIKAVAFGFIGFAYAPWLPLVGAMIVTGFAGTLIGRHLLRRVAQQRFALLFRTVLTLLGLRLLWLALTGLAA